MNCWISLPRSEVPEHRVSLGDGQDRGVGARNCAIGRKWLRTGGCGPSALNFVGLGGWLVLVLVTYRILQAR